MRTGSRGKFVEREMMLSQLGVVSATLPAESIKPPLVEYYIVALDGGGLPLVSRGDAGDPLRIAVPEPSKAWVLPVVIGASVLGVGAILGGLALAGVFKGKDESPAPPAKSLVTIVIGE
jgi:hypothetical protein